MDEAKIRKLLASQCWEDVQMQETMQGGFAGGAGEVDELLEAEGMRVGTGREERVAGLEDEAEPVNGHGLDAWGGRRG